MKLWQQIGLIPLLVSLAGGQAVPAGIVEVRDLRVNQENGDVTIQVHLSGSVKPSIETAANPDRLVLILPDTLADVHQERIPIHANGVRAVRMGLHTAEPPVTRVVIDLDAPHLYDLTTNGSTVTLQVHAASVMKKRVAPAPAASASVLGSVFNRSKPLPQPDPNDSSGLTSIPVPPSQPPIQFPSGESQPAAASRPAPSAAHPNYGSLQQGVVNPGMGEPGTGNVPAVVGAQSQPQNSGLDQDASAHPAGEQKATSVGGLPASESTSAPSDAATKAAAAVALVATPSTPAALNTTSANGSSVDGPKEPDTRFPSAQPSLEAPAAPESATSSAPSAVANPSGQTIATGEANADQPTASPDTAIPELAARRANPDFRIAFRVKYVASGAAYLDGGRAAGLAEGMKLVVRDTPGGIIATPAAVPAAAVITSAPANAAQAPGSIANSSESSDPTAVAELEVISVAANSAVTDIHDPKRDVKAGDLAYLSSAEQDALVQKSALSSTRKYPTVIAFTEGDTLDDEVRAEVPRPPMPSVNRARGRIGLDYLGTISHGSGGGTSSNLGLVTRLDMTRIGGTYWTASGYWRGRLTSSSYSGQQTIQDLINRTYHLSLTYDNPNSPWVAGFGRMYLPWATSLDTIDGGYFGRRLGHGSTLGMFLGSTPDPTSYSYNPDQQIAGSFINFDGGSFENFKYTSTSGAGVNMLSWNVQKPFVFFENGLYYKRVFSLYDALQFDSPSGNQAVAAPGFGLGRNFLTARYMPLPRLEFNASYNYFRDLPTFDPSLIGTGLLDKFLFQGLSGGVRVAVLPKVWLYTDIGKSNRTGDPTSSLNQLYGITFDQIPWIKMRADAHYSKFDSSFGGGQYEAVSLTRSLNDSMFLQVLLGSQRFSSQYTSNNQAKFVTTSLDFNIGLHYFVQGGFTVSRGATMDYDQYMFTLGYRFDTRRFKAQ